jgi:hypothetical protein
MPSRLFLLVSPVLFHASSVSDSRTFGTRERERERSCEKQHATTEQTGIANNTSTNTGSIHREH